LPLLHFFNFISVCFPMKEVYWKSSLRIPSCEIKKPKSSRILRARMFQKQLPFRNRIKITKVIFQQVYFLKTTTTVPAAIHYHQMLHPLKYSSKQTNKMKEKCLMKSSRWVDWIAKCDWCAKKRKKKRSRKYCVLEEGV